MDLPAPRAPAIAPGVRHQGNPAGRTSVMTIYMFKTAYMGQNDVPLANAITTFIVALSFSMILVTKALERRFGGRE